MSNESAPECLNHKDNRNIQVRLDYILLYRSEGKSKIIRTIETWTNSRYADWYKGMADSKEQKGEPPEEDMWITMSYDQFSLFAYGTIKHDTIKGQVDDLVALGHLERRVHPVYPYGPPQYRLNKEAVQKALNELEIPANLFDLVPMLVSPKKKHTPQETYPQGRGKKPTRDGGNIPPGTGETSHPSKNTTKNISNNHSKNESVPANDSPSDDSATSLDERDAHTRSQDEDNSHDTAPLQSESGANKSMVNTQAAAAPSHKTAATAQLSTLMASSPQRGAKVASRSAFVSAPLFESKQASARPTLTPEGKNVLEWFQTIQACRVRKTNENINAANGLAEEDGMSFENLKKAIEHWQADKFVDKNKIAIDLQTLENPKGKFTFAKAMLAIREKPKPTNNAPSTALPNLTGISNEEYYAALRRK